jgi:hypothetical protein
VNVGTQGAAAKRPENSVDLTAYKQPSAGGANGLPPVHGDVHAAIAALQAELPAIARSAEGAVPVGGDKMRKFLYADLAAIWAVVRPLVGRHGLALRNELVLHEDRTPEQAEALGFWDLRLTVTHPASGTSVVSAFPVWPRMSGAQGLAAATTFARRYALMLALGIVTEEEPDEDNIGEPQAPRGSWAAQRAYEQRAERSQAEQQQHAEGALKNAPAEAPPKVTRNQITVLWATAGARAKEIGDESITRETIVRELLRARGLASSGDVPASQFDEIVKAARRWSVPLPSDEVPPDDVPVDNAAAEEAFN